MLIQPPSLSKPLISRSQVASLRCAAVGLLLLTPLVAFSVGAPRADAQVAATETVVNSFIGGADGEAPEAALIVGPDGNFYGTNVGGGANQFGVVYQVNETNDPGAVDGLYPFGGVVGVPSGPLLLGSDGNFYGTTDNGGSSNEGTVFQLTPGGGCRFCTPSPAAAMARIPPPGWCEAATELSMARLTGITTGI